MGSLIFRKPGDTQNTRKVFGFPGGIHPPEHKTDSNTVPIRRAAIPAQLVLPLAQHAGAPAEPVVSVGDAVLKGQLIARAKGFVSANIHAPTSGVVRAIDKRPVQHPSGMDQPCIVIDSDGRDAWIAHAGVADWKALDAPEIIARIRDAGIAGMGGAGFPTAVKMSPRNPVAQLLLNAVECEPYITADDLLMRERAGEIIEGLLILRHTLKAAEVLVGIEDNKPEAIAAMRKAAANTGIDIVVVPTKYPSGGEKQLIQNLTGKEVPSGGLPADVGVVCTNTGTALAVCRAIVHGEPLISRVTTLTGAALKTRGNVEALIGTPISALLREAGIDANRLHRLVMGGPMMGFTLHDPNIPLVKTSNCLIAATAAEMPDPPPEQACIRCGACAEACPASLLPQQLYWYSKAGEFEKAQKQDVMDCIECGACAYVCPSSIPLVQYYRHAKGEIRKKQAEDKKADKAKLRFEARKARIEQEQAEREAKRKARAEAAKSRKAAPVAENAPADAAPAGAPAAEQDAFLQSLKNASLQASSDYKAAVKTMRDAEAAGSTDIGEQQRRVDELKARADAAKAAVRAAQQGELPAATANAAASPAESVVPANSESATETSTAVVSAEQMKLLKAAVASSTKQYKDAASALETAERSGAGNLDEMHARVAGLKQKADEAKAALETVVAQMKATARSTADNSAANNTTPAGDA